MYMLFLHFPASFNSGSPDKLFLHRQIPQIERVVDAWDWSQEDSVLHCVGLGSTYGLINSLQVLEMGDQCLVSLDIGGKY